MLNEAGAARATHSERASDTTSEPGGGVVRPWPSPRPSVPSTTPSAFDPIAIAAGALSVLTGLIFLVGGNAYGGNLSTHFSQVLMGCSFLALGLNSPVAARLIAVPTGLLNLAIFICYITLGPPGLDTVLLLAFWPTAPRFHSGDLNCDLAYALTAIAIVFLTEPKWDFRWRSRTLVLTGSAVLGLSLVGLLGWYLVGQQTAYGLRRMMNVRPPRLVAMGILGAGILALAWREGHQNRVERYAWILIGVAVTGVVVSTSLWQASILVPNFPIRSIDQFRRYLGWVMVFFAMLTAVLLAVGIGLIEKFRRMNDVLEERVQQQSAQLQSANKELEAFSYSVSHDLRAPLRHLSGFSELLLQESSHTLNETSRHYLDEIRDAANRMRQLVDELLDFSRMSRQDLRCKTVALNSVVSEVIRELSPEISGRQMEWQIAALPEVQGDPILLKQVFANLLSNAVKFTRPRTPAIIAVGEMLVQGKPTIFVRDNGVGFNMRYAGKLFGVFQRLHRSDEFEGTGIGLATVQRIVHRHGGHVWAESDVGKGATFYFTLDLSSRANRRAQSERASATVPRDGALARTSPPARNGPSLKAVSEVSEGQSAPSARSKLDLVAIATGALSIVLGVTFLGFASSLRGSLSTHFSLAAMGCAFLAMGLNWPMVARMIAIPIGLLNLITFIGYVKFGPPGLDTVIIEWLWPTTPKSFSGDLNADLGYALTALAILLLTESGWRFRWRTTAIVLAGSAVLGLGCVGLAGYLTGLQTAYGLHRLIEISFDSIIGTLILGAGLLVTFWRQGSHIPGERQTWILTAVTASGFVISTSLGQSLALVHKLPIESSQQVRSYLGNTAFLFGLVLTAVLTVAVGLVLKLSNLNQQLERLVQQQTSDVQAANNELEAFTYSVSHDLRAPLRHLAGFADLFLEESSDSLNETSRHYIDEIRDAADRMRQLVDGLLDFSRMSRQDLHSRTVSLDAIVSEVTRELSQETKERKIEWRIAALPGVQGDPILLKQVFVNLLANAVKFTRPRDLAVIEIGETAVNGEQTIFVRDNGVGFNMRYAEKLFGVFQRLHGSDEFEGMGIGLATVQRIVHRHGGHIWAQSEAGKGATFYFTLGSLGPQQPEVHYESAVAYGNLVS